MHHKIGDRVTKQGYSDTGTIEAINATNGLMYIVWDKTGSSYETALSGLEVKQMSDPIDNPNFNPATRREPNPETIAVITQLGSDYHAALAQARELRYLLNTAIADAKRTGHSFPQLRDASGLSIATIQKIVDRNAGWD